MYKKCWALIFCCTSGAAHSDALESSYTNCRMWPRGRCFSSDCCKCCLFPLPVAERLPHLFLRAHSNAYVISTASIQFHSSAWTFLLDRIFPSCTQQHCIQDKPSKGERTVNVYLAHLFVPYAIPVILVSMMVSLQSKAKALMEHTIAFLMYINGFPCDVQSKEYCIFCWCQWISVLKTSPI